MEKVAAAQVNQYLIKSAQVIRDLAAENKNLKAELANRDRHDQAEKIASVAVERGLVAEEEADTYAEHLANGGEDLKMIEDFVGRSPVGVPLGTLKEKTASAEHSTGEQDVLTAFLLGSDVG